MITLGHPFLGGSIPGYQHRHAAAYRMPFIRLREKEHDIRQCKANPYIADVFKFGKRCEQCCAVLAQSV